MSMNSEFVAELALEDADRGLVTLVEGPLPDPLGGDQPGPCERLQVRGGGRLGDAQLVGDEDHAHSVVYQVSVALGREIRDGVAEPFEDLQALGAGQGPEYLGDGDHGHRGCHRTVLGPSYSGLTIFLTHVERTGCRSSLELSRALRTGRDRLSYIRTSCAMFSPPSRSRETSLASSSTAGPSLRPRCNAWPGR